MLPLYYQNTHPLEMAWNWQARHNAAISSPIGAEIPIVKMVEFLESYKTNTNKDDQAFGWKIGDDYVLGDAIAEIVKSTLTLLNGELGRLDPGKIDKVLRKYAKTNNLNID